MTQTHPIDEKGLEAAKQAHKSALLLWELHPDAPIASMPDPMTDAIRAYIAATTPDQAENPTADRVYDDIDDPRKTGLGPLMEPAPECSKGETGECRYCANSGWFYGDPDLATYCGCDFGKLREELSTPLHKEGEADYADYDAGLLNDFGGGDVGWWQDYLRAEIGRANDFWREQVAVPVPVPVTITDETTILVRLAAGDEIAYSQDGDDAFFTKGDRAFIGSVIMSMREKGYLRRILLDPENYRGMSERDVISDAGLRALTAALSKPGEQG
jgi:hypothetical protein